MNYRYNKASSTALISFDSPQQKKNLLNYPSARVPFGSPRARGGRNPRLNIPSKQGWGLFNPVQVLIF